MDFREALNVKINEIERPPLPPLGHYVFKVTKYEFGEVGNGRFDTVDFRLQAVEAREDVDQEALSTAGGLKSVSLRHRFMFNKGETEEDKANFNRTLFNMKRFLSEHLGLGDSGGLKEAIDSSIGQQVLANVTYRPDPNDPEIQYAEIGRTAPVA